MQEVITTGIKSRIVVAVWTELLTATPLFRQVQAAHRAFLLLLPQWSSVVAAGGRGELERPLRQ